MIHRKTRFIETLIYQKIECEPNRKEVKLNADDTATPTYSSDTFSVTKSDGTTVIGQQQGQYITVPNAGLNNADWSGEITLVSKESWIGKILTWQHNLKTFLTWKHEY